jgi:hypothetical protein
MHLPGFYSLRRLFIGFARAARMAWKLMVVKAISKAAQPAAAKTHIWIFTR